MNLAIYRRWEAGLVVAAAMVVAGLLLASGRFDVGMDTRVSVLFEKSYRFGTPIYGGGKGEVLSDEWTKTPKGLRLAPGQSGYILVPVNKADQDARMVIKVRGRGGLGFRLAVLVSTDGHSFREVWQGALHDSVRVEFTPVAGESERLWIKLAASMESAASPNEAGILTDIRVFSKGPVAFPNIALACLLVSTPLLAYVAFATVRPERAFVYSLGILGGLAIISQGLTWTDPVYQCGTTRYLWWLDPLIPNPGCETYFLLPYGLLLGLLAWQMRIWSSSFEAQRRWAGLALLGILAWGGSLRLEQLVQVSGLPLDPDADYFRYLADAMRSPYDTAWREPLWVWIVKGLTWLGGTSTLSLRLLTIALSLLVVYSAYKLFSDYTRHPFVGLLVALLLALNPYLIKLSTRGMKEEIYVLLVLWFVHLVFVRSEKLETAWRVLVFALAGAAVLLVRLNSWIFVLPFILVWLWKHEQRNNGRRWVHLALALSFIGVTVVPHLVHNYREYGDPLFSVNNHAAWGRNYEFLVVKGGGCASCPTIQEMEKDSYAGLRLTTYDYFFKLHTFREVVDRLFTGFVEMYLIPTHFFEIQSGTQSLPAYWVYFLGLVLVLLGPHRVMLAVIALLINGVPFLMTLQHEPRIGVHTAPFVAFVLALGLWQCVRWSGLLCMAIGQRVEPLLGSAQAPAVEGKARHGHANRL